MTSGKGVETGPVHGRNGLVRLLSNETGLSWVSVRPFAGVDCRARAVHAGHPDGSDGVECELLFGPDMTVRVTVEQLRGLLDSVNQTGLI